MTLLASVLCVTTLVLLTHACDECGPICAFEKKDPTYKRTFKNKLALNDWNEGCENDDETFEFEYEEKCIIPEICPAIEEPLCAVTKPGVCGPPLEFKNFCHLDKYNFKNPKTEYVYYHDGTCNLVTTAEAKDCSCECDYEIKPVCAIPEDPCGRLVTFPNRCWLEKFNCQLPEYQLWYFHEGECLPVGE